MYILNIVSAIKQMTIKELKEFMYEYCNKQFLFSETSKEKSD